jgi:hypothetical protein
VIHEMVRHVPRISVGLSFCMLVSSIVIKIKTLLIDQIVDHFLHHPVHKVIQFYFNF